MSAVPGGKLIAIQQIPEQPIPTFWTLSASDVIALCALVTAVCALIIAKKQLSAMRTQLDMAQEHQELSVRPALASQIRIGDEGENAFLIANQGLGPGLIDGLIFEFNGKAFDALTPVGLNALMGEIVVKGMSFDRPFSSHIGAGFFVRPGTEYTIFKFANCSPDFTARFRRVRP